MPARRPPTDGDTDRATLFAILTQVVDRCGWLCHTYCLMINNYHLLIETLRPDRRIARYGYRHADIGSHLGVHYATV